MLKNRNFGQKSKFWAKIDILVKNLSLVKKSKFWAKIDILVKNLSLVKKSKFRAKIDILVKNLSLVKKSKFRAKIDIFETKSKFWINGILNGINGIIWHFWYILLVKCARKKQNIFF